MKFLFHFGKYILFLRTIFSKPEKFALYRERIFTEIESIGWSSLGIVAVVSVFLGGVLTLQSAHNLVNPLVPIWAVAVVTRDAVILEFSSTIVSLILAGKVGSSIASEIGTMRVTEQVDALEIMGINSSGYLVLPKIVAAIFINPFIMLLSMFLAIMGGYLAGTLTGTLTGTDYARGLQESFLASNILFSLTKMVVFAFVMTTVSAYQGYYTKGGSLEVGQASTKAVVYSSMMILFLDFILTQILLM